MFKSFIVLTLCKGEVMRFSRYRHMLFMVLAFSFAVAHSLLYGAAAPRKYWRDPMVRVVPYAIHVPTGNINFLLRLDPMSKAWAPASEYVRGGTQNRVQAQAIIRGIDSDYTFSANTVEQVDPVSGDLYYFTPVPFKHVTAFEKTHVYTWASGDDVSKNKTIVVQRLGKKEQIQLSQSFFDFLSKNWAGIAASIKPAPVAQKTLFNVQPQAAALVRFQHSVQLPVTTPLAHITGHGYSQAPITWPEYHKMLAEMFEKSVIEMTEATCYTPGSAQGEKNTYYNCSEEAFNMLDITLSPAQVRECYARFGVIVHRPPMHDTLIVGCGNLLPHKPGFNVSQVDDNLGHENRVSYRFNHAHAQCDTLDPEFHKNPTIVTLFGKTDLTELFGGHVYKIIFVEGLQPSVLFYTPESTKLVDDILAADGKIIIDPVQRLKGAYMTKQQVQQKVQETKK